MIGIDTSKIRKMLGRVGVVVLVGLAVPAVTAAAPVQAETVNGKLAFSAHSGGGSGNIFTVDPDGLNLTVLSDGNGDMDPQWSPDGTKIVFVSTRDGNYEIYVINADGSGQRNLTVSSSRDDDPVWSPDGKQIAFVSKRDGNYEVYVMNADGRALKRLTSSTGDDSYPAWSPDGKQIAFIYDSDVHVMNADGGESRNVTNTPEAYENAPNWQALTVSESAPAVEEPPAGSPPPTTPTQSAGQTGSGQSSSTANSSTTTGSLAADTSAPKLKSFKALRRTLTLRRLRKQKNRIRFSYELVDENASMALELKAVGRKSKRLRKTFNLGQATKGRHSFSIRAKGLKRGRYVARLIAKDAAGNSSTASARFRVR